MTYENRELVRSKRYTVRAQGRQDVVINMAAELTGMQSSTFIIDSALRRAEDVLQRAGVRLDLEQPTNASA